MEDSSSPGLNIHVNSSPLRYPAPNRKPGSAYPETPSSAGNPSSLHLAGHKTIIRPLLPAFPGWYNHPKGTYAGKEVFLTASNKNCALTLNERRIIQTGITNGSTKTAIANTIGKDKSTIGKEIKRHRILKHKCGMPLECSNYARCRYGRQCTASCQSYQKFHCPRRDRSPGACNGCEKYSSCRFDKYYYEAGTAHSEYRRDLVDSRTGVDLTVSQAKEMAAVIGPLLKQGHSPYQIVRDNPSLGICEKTLYNYIDQQVFSVAGICNIDLRRKSSRRISKKKAKTYKKREDRAFLKGREYKDYLDYVEDNPSAHILQMDTVYNSISEGPFIQTFKFIGLGMMIGIYHDTKTAEDMVKGLDILEEALGQELFNEHAHILLTDRGTEFSNAVGLEERHDKTRRCRVFYCDPMQSAQKGSLENNHELLRYICPKETDLRALGLTCQDKLNLALSHINSSSLESLAGKSPIEYTRFMFPELWEKLNAFGISEIPRKKIVLKPYLLK